ncbi:MAG TPA: hypothetical protein VFT90_17025 [Chryseosolibacter sp.]|nr:hypothetical protein [Chryseosolibacter sp.]
MSTFAVEAANSYMGTMVIIFWISATGIFKKAVRAPAKRAGFKLSMKMRQVAASNLAVYFLFGKSSNLRATALRS